MYKELKELSARGNSFFRGSVMNSAAQGELKVEVNKDCYTWCCRTSQSETELYFKLCLPLDEIHMKDMGMT